MDTTSASPPRPTKDHAHRFEDLTLRQAVEAELAWAPNVDGAGIGVAVDGGVVTLTGDVGSLHQRIAAIKAAERVAGVHTVADELRLPRGDGEPYGHRLAHAVDAILAWTSEVPHEGIRAEVHGHRIVLLGTVEWDHQRVAAKKAVQRIYGVHEVESRIELTRRPDGDDVEEQIRNAITRNAVIGARRLHVTADGSEVTLTGHVGSWLERTQAVRTAWSSPHVSAVHDKLIVDPLPPLTA